MNNVKYQSRRSAIRGWLIIPVVSALLLFVTACDSSSTGDVSETPVSIAFSTGAASGTSNLIESKRTVSDAAGNELEYTRIELILEEVEFERAESSDACRLDDDDDDDGDDCEEIERGPFAIVLPLDGASPLVAFESSLPVGEWDEVEFEVEPRDDDDTDLNTLVPVDESIRVDGIWTPVGGDATSFTWTSDLDADQEIEFEPPISVTADQAVNVTFEFSVDNWFRDASGGLIDPTQVDDDLEDIIEDNIEDSIEGFRDDDRDGDDDDDDDDGYDDDDDDEDDDDYDDDQDDDDDDD